MTKERVDEIDIIKGIGILLVIAGHLPLPYIMLRIIYSFHLPLFIIASGMVFNVKKVNKNVTHLLKIYIIAACLNTLIYGLLNKISLHDMIYLMLNLLLGGVSSIGTIKIANALWFLPCLTCIEILYWIIVKKFSKLREEVGVSILVVLIGLLVGKLRDKYIMFWSIDIACILLPFFVFGVSIGKDIFRNAENIKKRWHKTTMAACGIIILYVTMVNTQYINIYRGNYGKSILLYYFGGIAGFLLVCIFAIYVKNNASRRILIIVGRNSLVLLCTHQMLMYFIQLFLDYIGINGVLWRCGVIIGECISILFLAIIEEKMKLAIKN